MLPCRKGTPQKHVLITAAQVTVADTPRVTIPVTGGNPVLTGIEKVVVNSQMPVIPITLTVYIEYCPRRAGLCSPPGNIFHSPALRR